MKKLTDEQKKEIILKYKTDNSRSNLARICTDYNITRQYIYKLLKQDVTKEVENSIKEQESEFTKRANLIINQAFNRLEERLKDDNKCTISQLATLIGILYDKSRLENNLSTSNNSVNINIKIEK